MRRAVFVAVAAAVLTGCQSPPPPPAAPSSIAPVPTVAGARPETPVRIGPAAHLPESPSAVDALVVGGAAMDTVGGYLPGTAMLDPFEVTGPALEWLDPALLEAVQRAARQAATEDVEVRINSGWRSPGFQQRLLDDGVRSYGSLEAAREFVATPESSQHVVGKAVDIGPPPAAAWMLANGPRFGLCQIFANESWHFELAADERGDCPPLRPNAAG